MMENSAINAQWMQWLSLISTVIGFIAVLLKVGSKQGEQEEKNKQQEKKNERFEKVIDSQSEKIEKIEKDITDIKEDVSFIKGKIEGKV